MRAHPRRALRARLLGAGVAFAAALLAVRGAEPAHAGGDDGADAPPAAAAEGRDAALDAARLRWNALPGEKRERLLHLFRRFHELPADRRAALRRRFESLGGREGIEILRRQLDDLQRRDPDRLERLRRQGRAVADLEARILAALPEPLRARMEALDPEARQILRARAIGAATDAARRAVVARFATDAERAAIEGDDDAARVAALRGVFRRARDEAVAPHRERLHGLAPDARREAEDRLFTEALWRGAAVDPATLADRVGRALDQGADERARDARRRFHDAFGLTPEDVGVEGGARRLARTLMLVPPERQREARASLRASLQALRRLPLAQRREALGRILRTLVVEHAAPADPGENDGRAGR